MEEDSSPSRTTTTTGRPVNRLRDKIQMKLRSEQLQKRRQQAGSALKNFGNQLQKINLGKLIDQMESDQHLADSLEQFNGRMKEECERQGIRREAEARMLEVIQDHLEVFLHEYPTATYEDWIADLHPENANQGKLLSDIQEIDQRFYVYESDHRRLWNEAVEKLEDNEHRIVAARTQIWGKAHQNGQGGVAAEEQIIPMDLISGSVDFQAKHSSNNDGSPSSGNASGTIDFFADGESGWSTAFPDTQQEDEPSEDLIKF